MAAKILFSLCFLVWISEAHIQNKIFNVMDYGAIADEKTDNSVAFLKAWSDACKAYGKVTMLIPQGTYLLKEVIFSGPCNGWTIFKIEGVLKAPIDPYSFKSDSWINFRYIKNLMVSGPGTLDGQGSYAWSLNDCQNNPKCRPLPTTMTFDFVTNGYVHHLRSINSKQGHFLLFACQNMTFTKLRISAPSDSPNTDGIKIGKSNGINITSVYIGTGDDCIAMISGTRNVRISDVFCGPGHGISVGSLGKNDGEEDVADIQVKNCTFSGTTNGVRIKTWPSPLSKTLKASNFNYEDIVMNNVDNPIIIDQQYCPSRRCDNQVPSNVQISNVSYKNIRGSCDTEVAVSLNCSEHKPCQNIILENIDLWRYHDEAKRRLTNLCSYVHGASYGKQNPPSCI
uniref:Exopolygalacturonase-like n=1 Tax=Cicer arietinum TaxID=3827 RepID=A0A1S3E6A1_CICAR|nr:exopolygalacturonase-like [Cicer arietinum]